MPTMSPSDAPGDMAAARKISLQLLAVATESTVVATTPLKMQFVSMTSPTKAARTTSPPFGKPVTDLPLTTTPIEVSSSTTTGKDSGSMPQQEKTHKSPTASSSITANKEASLPSKTTETDCIGNLTEAAQFPISPSSITK